MTDGGLGGGTFKVGRLLGVDVKVHVIFLIMIGFHLFQGDPAQALFDDAVLFGSVLLHEIGHCLGARVVGGTAREVILWPLGGLALLQVPRTAWAELVSTVAGPFVNLLLCAVAVLLLVAGGWSWPAGETEAFVDSFRRTPLAHLGGTILWFNGVLFLFNVLPAYPMDGGRILRSMLWPVLGWRTATIASTVMAIGFGLLFLVGAMVGGGMMLGVIGVLVIMASQAELQRARAYQPLPWVPPDEEPGRA